jgi:hypothetical protein
MVILFCLASLACCLVFCQVGCRSQFDFVQMCVLSVLLELVLCGYLALDIPGLTFRFFNPYARRHLNPLFLFVSDGCDVHPGGWGSDDGTAYGAMGIPSELVQVNPDALGLGGGDY